LKVLYGDPSAKDPMKTTLASSDYVLSPKSSGKN
jgi:hypothetical protein